MCIKLWVFFFCLFQGRGNECSPGNSDLDVFFIYFTHSVAVSWEFFICQQDHSLKTKVDTWLK